nr:hypothetical protein [Tanacetum cinerariifolium]
AVIEFEDSYEVPANDPSTTTINTTSGEVGTKSGRMVTLTTEDMQKKKNDQYGNFRAEGSKTLEQTFTRLQMIVEWLMHTIVWRNRSDIDTMSLDDLYNHLKVYETEVQKKTEPNTQNMAFISSAKHSRGNDEVNTASVYTASSNVSTASANVATIDEDDMEEMDIKWNMALLSMRADKFWKKTGKKISIQGSDVAGFDKSKRSDKSKECLGYTAVPPPPTQLYLSLKKDLSWNGLPECANDTVTDYSRSSPTVESSSEEDQNRNPSVFENVASPITPKQFVKFVKASDNQSK